MGHKYYAELLNGTRVPITEWEYMKRVMAEGWYQVMALPAFTIIKKG